MREFWKTYLKVITYTVIGLILMISSFYLFINYFHSKEISNKLYITNSDVKYTTYKNNLLEITNNLNSFQSKNNNDKTLKSLYSRLLVCKNVLQEEGTLASINQENFFSYHDIYLLGTKFQSTALNICWAIQLSYVTDEEAVSGDLKLLGPHISNSVSVINNQTTASLSELQSNSSYFYTTNIASSTIRNQLSSNYNLIASSYVDFSKIVLELTRYLNESAEGGLVND